MEGVDEMLIDQSILRRWRDRGWRPSDPQRWTSGMGGLEYLIWEGYDSSGWSKSGAVGYLDCAEGPIKPIGPLIQISRKSDV